MDTRRCAIKKQNKNIKNNQKNNKKNNFQILDDPHIIIDHVVDSAYTTSPHKEVEKKCYMNPQVNKIYIYIL